MENIYTILEEIGFEEKVKISPRMMKHIMNGGDLSQKLYSIIQPFYEKVLDYQQEKYSELKRLQKEIDEIEEWKNKVAFEPINSEWIMKNDIQRGNQSKIKQIIEEL